MHAALLPSRGVGTFLFMSPEAFEGVYSDRSDMYSLGAVLYEMWCGRFSSSRERVRLLDALRRGSVPRRFVERCPQQTQLISNLMQAEAAKRPSASDLLRFRFFVWEPSRSAGSGGGGLIGGGGGGGSGGGAEQLALQLPPLSGEVAAGGGAGAPPMSSAAAPGEAGHKGVGDADAAVADLRRQLADAQRVITEQRATIAALRAQAAVRPALA